MGFGSSLKKAFKKVQNVARKIDPIGHKIVDKAVSQDSRNIRSLAKLFGGSATGSGWASSLYREAAHNVQNPQDAQFKAALTAATWYAGGAAGAWAGGAGASAGLTAAQQAALAAAAKGATMGALNAGANGGNVWRGALTGGLTGGLGGFAGPAISSYTGMPLWAGNALGAAGTSGLAAGINGGNPWAGALSGGIGSLASSGLSALGAPGFISQMGGRLAGNFAGGLAGGSGGSQGGFGYPSASTGGFGAPSITGAASRPGLAGGWSDTDTIGERGSQAYLQQAYGPVQAETNRHDIADALADNPDFVAKLKENPNWLA